MKDIDQFVTINGKKAKLKVMQNGEWVQYAPVIYAKWIPIDRDGSWRVEECSACNKRTHYVNYDVASERCPHCGAIMDGE